MTMKWWFHLSAREKGALSAAGVVVLLAIYYLGFWSPLSQDIALNKKVIAQLEADYRHMLQAEAELGQLQVSVGATESQGERVTTVSLLAEVDSSLQRGGLAAYLNEIKPDGEQIVRVSLDKAPFERVVMWLEYLRSNGVDVTKASVNAAEESGHVRMAVQLRDQRR